MRPPGIVALTILFYLGTVLSFAAALSLMEPGTILDGIWRLDPVARAGLTDMGGIAIPILIVVSVASALAAAGLWIRQPWGRWAGIFVLVVTMVGNFANVFFQGDGEALVGLPITGVLTAYLMSGRARRGEPANESAEPGEDPAEPGASDGAATGT